MPRCACPRKEPGRATARSLAIPHRVEVGEVTAHHFVHEGDACERRCNGRLRALTWSETVNMHGSAPTSPAGILSNITGLPATLGRGFLAQMRDIFDGGIQRARVLRCGTCLTYHVYHATWTQSCENALWAVSFCPASYTVLNCAGCNREVCVIPDDSEV